MQFRAIEPLKYYCISERSEAVMGGAVSNMQGGNFWEGAAIGLTVGLLNHASKPLSKAIDNMFKNDQQHKTLEEKVSYLLKKYKVKEKIDLDDFGDLLDFKSKKLINYIEKTSETNFRIDRSWAGRRILPENVGFKIEKVSLIGSNGAKSKGIRITPYGLPASQVQYNDGTTHKFNSFIINDNVKTNLFQNKFFKYSLTN